MRVPRPSKVMHGALGGWSYLLCFLVRAQDITVTLPTADNLIFTLESSSLTGSGQDLSVIAGVSYTSLRVDAVGQNFASLTPKLRIVQVNTQASLGGCASESFIFPGGDTFVDRALAVSVSSGDLLSTSFSFMMGGIYRLCYSSDGTFSTDSSLLPVPFEVHVTGARKSCNFDRCLEEYPWRCFIYGDEPAPSCILRMDALENFDATKAQLLWGPVSDGSMWPCGAFDGGNSSHAALLSSAPLVSGPVTVSLGSSGREFALQPDREAEAFSVQTCLCPDLDLDLDTERCNASEEFVQRVGRAIFFRTRLCDDALCITELVSVTPSSKFVLQINCGGLPLCSSNTGSRVKIIDYNPFSNDLPSWHLSSGCRVATQSPLHWSPVNCASFNSCLLTGGTDATEKFFTDLVIGASYLSGEPVSSYFDVCYCDDECDGATSGDAFEAKDFGYFKVGRIRVTPLRLLTNLSERFFVHTAAVPGHLVFEGSNIPVAPHGAQMKLMWDNSRTATSAACAAAATVTFSNSSNGPLCTTADSCSHRASTYSTGVVFNDGGLLGERVLFQHAGVVAMCYCAVLDASGNCDQRPDLASYWIFIGRTAIRGPCASLETSLCVEQAWSFPVGLNFRIVLKGLALRSTDKVRIISAAGDCSSTGDGGGEPTIFKGCPGECTPLDRPDTYVYGGGFGKDDIDLHVDHAANHSCNEWNENCSASKVIDITINADHLVLRFDSDPGLQTGDLIVLDNVTGGSDEENRIVSGQIGIEPIGHPVTRLSSGYPGAEDGLIFSTPVALGSGLRPPFLPGDGGWTKPNLAKTQEELIATEAKTDLQVCWGSGPDTYHVRAGLISFTAPEQMPSASLHLTTLEGGAAAPLVISFTTNSVGQARQYGLSEGNMRLRIRFHDVSLLEPRLADAAASFFDIPADGNSIDEAALSVCGAFFLELWSDDARGFPLPKGCYFGPAQGQTREMNLLFERKNGLERRKNYQLVINAIVASGTTSSHNVVAVWSMDEVTLPYGVVEVGDARLSSFPVPASSAGEPRFSVGGFEVLDPTGAQQLVQLQDPATVLLRLRGQVDSPISASATLRLFLRPLMMWDLPLCEARCFPHQSLSCGAMSCTPQEVVFTSGRRNVVKLTLPSDMTPLSGVVQHTVQLAQLTLPLHGFFGARWAAEVALPDDSRAHYSESTGVFLWKVPRSHVTLAGVVNVLGDGNLLPFRGQQGNQLYVQLLLGASLFAELQDGDASFSLLLPPGYVCLAAAAAPETLRLFGSGIPQGRGSLQSSNWDFDGTTCRYRLKAGELIPAGTSVYVQVTVNQPQTVLPIGGVNEWSLQLRSRGHYRISLQELPRSRFVEQPNLGSAVSVLGRLQQSLVPSTFQASVSARLYVFFKPEQSSGYGGYVHISCPRTFDVGLSCDVQPLDQVYYRIANDQQDTVYLPVVRTCMGECTDLDGCEGLALNTAKIALENPVLPQNSYGFQLLIQNPSTYSIQDEVSWAIYTTDALNRTLDAAQPAVLNPNSAETGAHAWGVFQAGSTFLSSLAFSSLWPTAVTGSLVLLTVIVQVSVSFTATARFISPVGFNLEPSSVQGMAAEVGADMNWPGGLLSGTPSYALEPANTLLWSSASYSSAGTVGFSVACEVPNASVATMFSAGLLQFGWDASTLAERPLSLVLPVDQVRSIVNFRVDYLSNVVSARQRIFVSLQTMSDVPIGGRLVLTAPSVFDFQSLCSVLTVPGEPAPAGWETLQCQAQADGEITLRPSSAFIATGSFTFALDAWNPDTPLTSRVGHATPCGHENCWKVEIFNTVGGGLDAPAYTASFPVNQLMPHAQLVDLNAAQRYATGRNDRPGQRNQLIFAFSLALSAAMGTLRLVGPLGFVFDEDCLPGLSTSSAAGGVFGSLAPLPGFYAWETAAKVQSCVGRGSRATMHVDLGLRSNRLYAFRVTVMNPLDLPEINTWSLEFSRESAAAFPSFTVWTFTDISLTPKFRSISATDSPPNPVTLRFRPHKDVPGQPAGGMLRITVAPGFQVARQGGDCEEFFLSDLTASERFSNSDVACTAGADTVSFVFQRRLDPGRLYELILQVVNPVNVPPTAEPWIAWTYSDATGSPELAMDRTSFPGFRAEFRLSTWEVRGPNMEQHAGQSALLDFALASSSSIGAESRVIVYAPKGFDLTSPPDCAGNTFGSVLGGSSTTVGRTESLNACALRVWQEVAEAEAASWRVWDGNCQGHLNVGSLQICEEDCSDVLQQVCNLQVTSRTCHRFSFHGASAQSISATPSCLKEQLLLVLGQGDAVTGLLHFQLEVKNPVSTPDLVDSFWIAEVHDAAGVSTAAQGTWRIIPLLPCQVLLVGPKLAAGSISSIQVQLTSPVNGDAVRVDALTVGFDLSGATSNGTVLTAEELSMTVNQTVIAGLSTSLQLDNVVLGPAGAVRFAVAVLVAGVTGAEDLNVSDLRSFNVPDVIVVESHVIAPMPSELAEDAQRIAAGGAGSAGAFLARRGSAATVRTRLRLKAALGHELRVSAAPFTFNEATLQRDEVDLQIAAVANMTTMRITLREALPLGDYDLSMAVITGPEAKNGEQWFFELWSQAADLPTATNDGAVPNRFSLVEVLTFSVSTGRVAPSSLAELQMTVQWTSPASPRQLVIYAPMGFVFPSSSSCLRDSITVVSEVLSCAVGDVPYIASMQLHSNVQGLARTVLVATAPAVASGTWLVRALAEDGAELGWAVTSTFPIATMESASVAYGGIPSTVVHVSVAFQTSQTLLGGGEIQVVAPAVYAFSCDEGFKLFFVGLHTCESLDQGFRLMLNQSLAPGRYAVIIGMRTPSFTPMANFFDLLLKDTQGKVLDSQLQIPGQQMIQGLNLQLPQLQFSTSEAGKEAEIRMVFRVAQTLDPLQALGPLRALQIAVPERFTLIVREPVTNLDGLPTPEVGWYHLYFLEKLVRVDLVSAGEEPPQIPAKDYRLAFKVRLPEFWMPSVNVWMLSLCRDLSCSDLITSLPVAGFQFGDAPDDSFGNQATDSLTEPGRSRGRCAQFVVLFLASRYLL